MNAVRWAVALCVGLPAATGTQDPAPLRLAWTPPTTLDPARGATLSDARILAALFEGLVTFGPDHRTPEPGVAERWKADGLTWTFHLRDTNWSDGTPVTAGDFVFAWRRLLEPGAAYPDVLRIFRNVGAYSDALRAQAIADDLLASISVDGRKGDLEFLLAHARKNSVPRLRQLLSRGKGDRALLEQAIEAAKGRDEITPAQLGFEAPDARTLRVVLERPAPWLLDALGFMALYPVPEKSVRALGEKWADPRILVANGPYRIEKSEDGRTTLVRVRGSGPEKVVLDWVQPDEALRKFRAKQTDWLDAETIPAKELLKVSQEKEFQYFDLWGTWFLRFNGARDPFRKPEARRAVAHATDRAGLVELVRCNPWTSLVPPGLPGYRSPEAPRFSRSAAMEWLLKAYVDVTAIPKIEFLVPDGSRAAAERLKEQWEKTLGVEVHISAMRGPAYVQALAAGKFDVALGAWVGDALDPSSFLEPWVRGGGRDFAKLVEEARGEADPARRFEILAAAERNLIAEECAIVPLWLMGSYQLVSSRVKGAVPNPLGRVLLRHLTVGR